MRKGCRDLSLEERQDIYKLRERGLGIREIAKRLGRSPSAICRELKRRVSLRSWGRMAWYEKARLAQDGANQRRRAKRDRYLQLKNSEIQNYVYEKLKMMWSPEVISLRIGIDIPGASVSAETIYQYIYRGDRTLIRYLVRQGKSRRVRGGNRAYHRKTQEKPAKRSIEQRPTLVEQRKELGHLESDLIVSCRQGNKCLHVSAERSSRRLWLALLDNREAATVRRSQFQCINSMPSAVRRSLTLDNGPEHAHMANLEKVFSESGFLVYYCHPYSAWERGTVEAINGILRWHFPKGTNFDNVYDRDVKAVQDWFNNRPMKVLGGRTPMEVYEAMLMAQAA